MSNKDENWGAFFVLGEQWQSDLQFYEDELRFMRSLVDKYFIWLIEDHHIDATKAMALQLTRLEKGRQDLDQRVSDHMKNLAALAENPLSRESQVSNDEHGALERAIADFLKEFRVTKKGLFELTEQVIESKKAQYVLGR